MRLTAFSRAFGLFVLLSAALWVGIATAQDTGVTAEAKEFANLRSGIGVETEVVGQIQIGTRYPVLARSQYYPWLMLGTQDTFQPLGWVFQDLVNVTGSLNAVPFSELGVEAQIAPTSTLGGGDSLPTSTLGSPLATSTPGDSTLPPPTRSLRPSSQA